MNTLTAPSSSPTLPADTENPQIATESTNGKGHGKYLTFSLGAESYGTMVLQIRELLRIPEITSMPQLPLYMRGVINLRGTIVPVIDLRRRFSLRNELIDERTCIIVVEVTLNSSNKTLMGLVVDAVEEVVNIPEGEIQKTPEWGSRLRTEYIIGVAQVKGQIKTLINIEALLTSEDGAQITASLKPPSNRPTNLIPNISGVTAPALPMHC